MSSQIHPSAEIKPYCNEYMYSDILPYEVVRVDGKKAWLRQMTATATPDSDYFGKQEYTYASNPDAVVFMVRLNKRGVYKAPKDSSIYMMADRPRYYRDPSF